MKKRYYFLIASVALISTYAVLQTGSKSFEDSYDPIAKELEKWDPIRGPWLAASLDAMSANKPIPDRMFPEDLTPYQMISLLPDDIRSKLVHLSGKSDLNNLADKRRWESIKTAVKRPTSNCGTLSARTYGDPHLVTFDGARYSFQTVGEFVLTRSTSGMEIQSRQKPQKEDFSLNTAIAMRVGGDRVGIYASDFPDANSSTPVWVNGQPVTLNYRGKHFLPNGGVIRKESDGDYRVDWPSGEFVTVDMRSGSGMRFMNVNIEVSKCGGYNGLLGNANGIESDDFAGLNDEASLRIPPGNGVFGGGSSQEIEQSRLAYLANTLGDRYRITPSTSLFDYAAGQSTYSFTNRAFPRVHRTLEEISQEQREEARRRCREEGIRDGDMNGCIFDQAHLEIEPAKAPVSKDPAAGIVLKPIITAVANVNPKPIKPANGTRPAGNGNTTLAATSRPLEAEEIEMGNTRPEDIRDEQSPQSKPNSVDEKEQKEREREERERQERLKDLEAERIASDRLEREEERERQDKERRERREKEAAEQERMENARIEKEEARREERKREAEREARKKQQEEAEREEREKRKIEAEQKAKAEADRKRQEDARKRKEAAAKKAKEEAARKAREEAARKAKDAAAKKAKEEAARKAREEALKKSR